MSLRAPVDRYGAAQSLMLFHQSKQIAQFWSPESELLAPEPQQTASVQSIYRQLRLPQYLLYRKCPTCAPLTDMPRPNADVISSIETDSAVLDPEGEGEFRF